MNCPHFHQAGVGNSHHNIICEKQPPSHSHYLHKVHIYIDTLLIIAFSFQSSTFWQFLVRIIRLCYCWLQFCLSICHTRNPCLNGSKYWNAFCTTWHSDVASFLRPNFVVITPELQLSSSMANLRDNDDEEDDDDDYWSVLIPSRLTGRRTHRAVTQSGWIWADRENRISSRRGWTMCISG